MIKWVPNNRCFIVVKNRFLASLLFKKAFGLAVILLFAFLPLLSVEAAPNYQINYQGKLHDSAGDPVTNGDYDIVFNLYTASSGGSPIWTESHTGANDVTTADGLFSVMLGSITSIASVNFNQTLYLGVTVEADSEMTPRKVLGTVPSAFEADKLDGLTSADFISTSTTALPNVWSASGLGSVGSSTATTTFLGNLAAAGSSILNGILTVFDRVSAPYFVATSTSVASVFPYASTTMITSTTASTTNLIISGLGSGLTKVTNGVVSLAAAGTDYLTSAFQNWQISGGYLTPTTTQVVKVDGLISTASSTVSGLLTTDYASTTALTISGSGNSFNITNSSATSTILGDVNIAGSTGVTIWTNEGNSNVAQGSLNIGSATPQNGFAVTRLGGSDTTFARFTEAGGALAQFVDGTGIQLDFRDTSVVSRIRFDTNGDNYISPATGNVYFSPAAGNVGIGTSTPQADLNIGNNIAIESTSAGSSVPSRSTLGGAVLGIGLLDTGPYIQSYASQPLLLNPGGNNVGIGTTSPFTILSVEGSGATSFIATIKNTSAGGDLLRLIGDAGNPVFDFESGGTGGEGVLNILTDNVETVQISSRASEFTYFNAGNVGIGTSTPLTNLEVAGAGSNQSGGNLRLSNTTAGLTQNQYVNELQFYQSDSTSGGAGITNALRTISIPRIASGDFFGTVARLGFFVSGNSEGVASDNATLEALTLMPGGKVGVGTTSPYARLSVAGETVAERFTATSTSLASVFPYASSTALTVSGQSFQGGITLSDTTNSGILLQDAGSTLAVPVQNMVTWVHPSASEDTQMGYQSASLFGLNLRTGGSRTFIINNSAAGQANMTLVGTQSVPGTFSSLNGFTFDNSEITAAQGSYGTGINFTGLASATIKKAGIYPIQVGSDPDQLGIDFFSSESNVAAADTPFSMRIYGPSVLIGTTTSGAILSASSTDRIGLMIDQRGTSDILRLLDAGTNVFTVADGGNVGIGTTTPGTLLGLGATGNSTINLTPTGTSTFGLGLNLRGGCYAINNTCIGSGSASLSGGTAGMLAAWTSSSALTATGTPNFDAFNATSTSATSTIAGGLAIETSGFVYDFTTNFVGIGTASPKAKLDIVGAGAGSASVLMDNNTSLAWRNSSGSTRTVMSVNSGNGVDIKTADGLYVRFVNSTGTSELARFNQTNYASFGIGTSTPGAMISASSSDTAISLMIDQQGTGDIARFLDAGSPVLTIKDGGNIGIGTSSPDYLLTIGNTASAANNRIAIDAAAARQSSIAFRSAGVNRWFIGRGDSDVLSDSSFFIGNTSGGTNNDPGGASAKLTINSSGLVGIGTSTAATTEGLLHVADNSTGAVNAVLSNTNSGTGAFASWQVRNGGSLAEGIRLGVLGTGFTTSGGFIQDGGFLSSGSNIAGGLSLITQGSAPLRFYTNGSATERLIITSGGLVGVGTTTPGAQLSASSTSEIGLMVDQRGTADIARFLDAGSTVFRVADGGEVTLGPGTSNPGIQLQEAGTMRWTIYNDNTNDRFYITDDDTDNGVYIAQDATSWTANSDIRLKENIVPIEGALEKLLNLTGYTYNFKGTKRNEIGLIAQEVLPLFPELVDTNGTYLGLTYDRLGPIIIQAIKEQQLQIEEISDLTSTSTTMWSLDEDTGNLTPFGLLNLNNQDLLNVKSITSASGNWSIGEDGTLTAKKIQTEELCVGNVCIDQDDLRDILRSADINFLDHINNDDDDNSTTTDDTATSTDDTATTTDETDIEEGDGSASSTPPVEPDPEPELETPTGDEIPTDNGGTEPEPPAETPPAE